MNEAVITRDIVKAYRKMRALDGFSLSVPRGSTMGLVGSNGAGKTTWMMMVAGLVTPTSGTVSILGLGPFDASKHSGRISILPQDSELPLEARTRELLFHYARLQGLSAKTAADEAQTLLKAFNLLDKADAPIRSLSHGMRKRIMVAQAFLGSPEVVLLDEPLSGLDPIEADRMRAFIREKSGRATIIISSHNLDDLEKLCSHIAFINKGRLERVDTLRAIVSKSGCVVVTLKEMPSDIAALEREFSGFTFVPLANTDKLEIHFDGQISVQEANERILPKLFKYGVTSVVAGRSLEQTYLQFTQAHDVRHPG